YMLEFSIESNAETAVLVLDGEEQKMHREGENYVCRTSFGDGDHEYYFLLDETRFPERGSYRITEVERRWILLSSLIDKFNWKLDEERELARKQKNTEELFKLQKSRIEACAMIQGVTKRILVSEVFDPKNFNTENVFDKIDMEKLDKLTKEYDIKRERKGDTLESLYTFFKELGGNYIAVAANSYGEKSNRIGHDKKAVQELEAAKKEKDWISVTERADRLIKDGQETEKALKYKYLALTRLYGDKSVELLKREENKGYSVRTLYDWTGECHPDKTKYHQGYTFINQVDAYWGKLLGVEAMDFDILAAGNCSLYCMDVEVQMSVKHGCIVIPPDQGWNVTAHNENYLSLSRVSYKVSPWIDLWGNPHYRTLMNATANFDDHEENFDGVVTVSLNFKVGT
ncbi:MAG: hypothetical protein U9N35_08260, partial [Euryarchaeota archaeon]|nr:hypothetical protein [Euryarchaeota archaeon]